MPRLPTNMYDRPFPTTYEAHNQIACNGSIAAETTMPIGTAAGGTWRSQRKSRCPALNALAPDLSVSIHDETKFATTKPSTTIEPEPKIAFSRFSMSPSGIGRFGGFTLPPARLTMDRPSTLADNQ